MVTHKSGQPRKSLPKWAWVVGSLVLIVALIAAVSFWYQSTPRSSGASPVSSSGSGKTAVQSSSPSGCLAGSANSTNALIAGQKDAEHSEAGAVSVAAAVMRWGTQYPRPTAEAAKKVAENVLADGATGTIADLEKNVPSTETFPGINSAYLSFSDGRYAIEEKTDDMVRVTLGASQFENGQELDQKYSTTLTMVWENEMWKIRADGSDRSLDELYASGSTFAGGC